MEIKVSPELRLCKVGDELGYFHLWECYSKPVEASPLVGGAPAGIISYVVGIVEFPRGVEYVHPTNIIFVDEQADALRMLNEHAKEKMNSTMTFSEFYELVTKSTLYPYQKEFLEMVYEHYKKNQKMTITPVGRIIFVADDGTLEKAFEPAKGENDD